ncbi:MAG: helix-turn-helix domain-containing protein [Acidobacteriota bacterium]
MVRTLDDLLNTRDSATYLDLSPRTLEKWRLTGGGPAFLKLGRSVRYRVSDLEAFLAERRRLSTSESWADRG